MGFFRRLKAKDYTEAEAKKMVADAKEQIEKAVRVVGTCNRVRRDIEKPLEINDQYLIDWAVARELLARKQNKNQSDVE